MKKLSIIIPAYNEEETIVKILTKLNETKPNFIEYEIIIINDASNDETKNIFSKEVFREMKKSAFFINIGRGDTVIENDLIEELKSTIFKVTFFDYVINIDYLLILIHS